MKTFVIVFNLFLGSIISLPSLAQQDAKYVAPTHIIQYSVSGVETDAQAKKLNDEMLSKKGIYESTFDVNKKVLTVKTSLEIEEKHIVKAIVKAGFKPIDVIK